MRRFIAVMSVMMLLPILAACSSKGSDADDKVRITAKPKDQQAATDDSAKPDEESTIEVSTDDQAEPEKPADDGYEYLNEFIDLICSYSLRSREIIPTPWYNFTGA